MHVTHFDTLDHGFFWSFRRPGNLRPGDSRVDATFRTERKGPVDLGQVGAWDSRLGIIWSLRAGVCQRRHRRNTVNWSSIFSNPSETYNWAADSFSGCVFSIIERAP